MAPQIIGSIKKKLITLIMVTTISALLTMSITVIVVDQKSAKTSMVERLDTLSRIIAEKSIAALRFNDEEVARNMLKSLKQDSSVLEACTYNSSKELFALYSKSGSLKECQKYATSESMVFSKNHLHLSVPITLKEKTIGILYIKASLNEINERFRWFTLMVLGITVITSIVAYFLANKLQRIITNPLIRLKRRTEYISDHSDYSKALKTNNNDEIGDLYFSFNKMIEKIQVREIARDKAELALRQNAERFSRWKESNFIGIIHMRSNGTIFDANKTILDILGFSDQDLQNGILNSIELTPNEYHHLDNHAIEEAALKGYWTPYEKELTHKDGSRIPVLLGGSIFHDDNQEFIVFIIDLTERKQQEEQIRRTQKMDALGKLTGGVAHDFNNVLNIIIGFSELLKIKLRDQPQLLSYTKNIIDAGNRGAKLTRKLLAFSHKSDVVPTQLNINNLINEQRDMLQKSLTIRIKLKLDLEKDIWSVLLDASDLEDVILNICINSMHAMEEIVNNPSLTIRTCNKVVDRIDANLLDLSPGDYVQLSITDTGCGMDSTTKEKIFDPFFTTKGSEGTGLGLSQVFGFVKRAKGAIRVYSEIDQGTQLVLYFHRFTEDVSNQIIAENSEQTYIGGNESILVVDDEKNILILCSDLLQSLGYEIYTATSAKEALKILKINKVDLMISDIIMPEMDGYQLSSVVNDKYPKVKILLASGFSDEHHVLMVDQKLRDNILHKPYDLKILCIRIRERLS